MKKYEPARNRLLLNMCKALYDSGKSDRQVAEEIGLLSHSTIGAWRRGKAVPNVITLMRFCKSVGITLEEVTKGIEI